MHDVHADVEADSEPHGSKMGAEHDVNVDKGAENSDSTAQDWQAVYAPDYQAYYFFNTQTHETTWTNPLLPKDASCEQIAGPSNTTEAVNIADDAESVEQPAPSSIYDAALAQGIDPALAHLDPTLAYSSSMGGPSTAVGLPAFTAKFNARTGAFTRPDGRDPSHLSEHERARRMSEFYFDVNAWEKELALRGGRNRVEEGEGEGSDGRKRKRPTKKDIERFKEQKRLKKIAKTAWLRS